MLVERFEFDVSIRTPFAAPRGRLKSFKKAKGREFKSAKRSRIGYEYVYGYVHWVNNVYLIIHAEPKNFLWIPTGGNHGDFQIFYTYILNTWNTFRNACQFNGRNIKSFNLIIMCVV